MKKILCLVLAMLVIFSLVAGCASGGETTTTPAPSTGSTGSSGSTSGGSTDTGSTGGDTTEESPKFTPNPPIDWPQYPVTNVEQDVLRYDMVAQTKELPLCGQKETFSCWWPITTNEYWSNFNEVANIQEMENRTNIHIDYVHPSANELAANFALMIASDDYCDMVFYAGLYTGGGDKAIEDGVFIRLNELIEEHAPNYDFIRNYTADGRKMTITSAGNIWSFYNVCYTNMPGYMGLNIREDIMKKAGIEERPVTIDDWDYALGVMMDTAGTEYAFGLPPTGVTRHSAFLSAWDIGSEWFQRDGVAMYGPAQPEFRNYVELMKGWYDKGYLRSDFYAVAPDNYNSEITMQDYGAEKFVACDGSNGFGTMLLQFGMATNPDLFCVAVRQPVLKEGDEIHIRYDQGVVNKGVSNAEQLAITTACENPELLCSWVDYRYTYEGSMLIYYGVPGLTYVETSPYHIAITENIINNPDGINPMTYMGKYKVGSWGANLGEYTNGWCFLDPAYGVEIQVWAQDKCDHNYPDIDMLTAEAAAEYTALYADIKTYIDETIPKFIIGAISMDEFDDFQSQLKAMGLDRCVELKQEALNDYNSR